MPYATPTSPATSPMLTTHSLGRPGHRRSYSAHQPTNTSTNVTSSPGGAFTSLRPPSRKQKFHLNPSSSSSSESEDDDGPPPPLKLRAPLSPSFGGVPFPRSSPLNSPVPNERDGGLLSPLAGLQTHITNLPGSPRTSPRSSSQNISVSTANPSYLAVPKRPQPSRTASSPILLSNGKPLKSSLKSSSSTSNIPVQHPSHPNYQPHQHRVHHHHHHQPTSHQRVRSAPSTPWAEGGAEKDDDEEAEDRSPSPSPSTAPSTPKNVHFPSLPNDLEHIRVFNKSAKPISFLRRSSDVSRGPTGVISTGDVEIGGETETETETDTSKGGYWGTGAGSKWGMSGYLKSSVGFSWGGVGSGTAGGGGQGQQGFPFPRVPSPPRIPSPPKQKEEVEEYLELDLKEGYDVSSQSTADKHVVLEKIQLERGKGEIKLLLTVLVKNIAYEKQVYFRFTMDDWATVSEVGGKYMESVTAPKGVSAVGRTLGDIISMSSSLHTRCASEPSLGASASHDSYDRFLITLSLTDYLHLNLENRVMWGVVRYTVPGKGEWWDNNGGKNYRVGWKKVVIVKPQPQPQPQPSRERKEVPAPSRAIAMSAPASTLSQPPPSISVMSTSPPASSLSSFTMPAYAPPMSMSASPPTSSFMSSYSASPPTSSFMSSYSPPKPYSPPKSYSPPDTNTTPATYSPTMTKISLPTSPPDTKQTEALSQATQNRLSKFSLRNYVAPGSVPHAASTNAKPASAKPNISISIEGATPEKKKPEQGKGLGLHWPWHSGASTTTSSSSTSTNSTPTPKASDPSSTTEPKSQSPVVTPGGSATVEILGSGKKDYFGDVGVGSPSTKSSSTPVPVPASVSRTSSMSSTNSDGVPSLDEDGQSTGSTTSTSSSESLDSLMFGGRSSSPYQHHQQPQSYRDDEFVGFDWHGVHGLHHNDEEKGNSGSETEKPLSQEQSQFEVSPSPSPIEESPVMVTSPTSNGSEGLYKAFVEKWCFAESPRGTAGGARGLEVSS